MNQAERNYVLAGMITRVTISVLSRLFILWAVVTTMRHFGII
jgi:hypothetical protein